MNTLSMARRLAAGIALAVACVPAQAAEPFALAGHVLGLPYDPVVKDARYDCESLAGCFLYSVCKFEAAEGRQFAGTTVDRVSLYFQGERLSGIQAEFPGEQYDSVAAALAEEHGPPDDEATKAEGNAALAWRQGSRILRIARYARPGRSSVILADRSFIRELLER
jgi:hypothetical protein